MEDGGQEAGEFATGVVANECKMDNHLARWARANKRNILYLIALILASIGLIFSLVPKETKIQFFTGDPNETSSDPWLVVVAKKNGSFDLPDCDYEWEHHRFVGWRATDRMGDYEKPVLEPGSTVDTDAQATYYAAWETEVSYKDISADGDNKQITQWTDSTGKFTLSECSFERAGYIFSGWSKNQTEGVMARFPGEEVETNGEYSTYYALWIPSIYKIEINTDESNGIIRKAIKDWNRDKKIIAAVVKNGTDKVLDYRAEFKLYAKDGREICVRGDYAYAVAPEESVVLLFNSFPDGDRAEITVQTAEGISCRGILKNKYSVNSFKTNKDSCAVSITNTSKFIIKINTIKLLSKNVQNRHLAAERYIGSTLAPGESLEMVIEKKNFVGSVEDQLTALDLSKLEYETYISGYSIDSSEGSSGKTYRMATTFRYNYHYYDNYYGDDQDINVNVSYDEQGRLATKSVESIGEESFDSYDSHYYYDNNNRLSAVNVSLEDSIAYEWLLTYSEDGKSMHATCTNIGGISGSYVTEKYDEEGRILMRDFMVGGEAWDYERERYTGYLEPHVVHETFAYDDMGRLETVRYRLEGKEEETYSIFYEDNGYIKRIRHSLKRQIDGVIGSLVYDNEFSSGQLIRTVWGGTTSEENAEIATITESTTYDEDGMLLGYYEDSTAKYDIEAIGGNKYSVNGTNAFGDFSAFVSYEDIATTSNTIPRPGIDTKTSQLLPSIHTDLWAGYAGASFVYEEIAYINQKWLNEHDASD